MKKTLLTLFGIATLLFTGCCKNCDLSFEDTELLHLAFNASGGTEKVFANSNGDEVTVRLGDLDVQESGKTCGGFGSPDEDFCSMRAVKKFTISGGIDNAEVTLTKTSESGFGNELRLEIHMGKTNIYVLFDDDMVSQTTLDNTETLTVGGTTYDDVLSYLFNPNTDCKDPNDAICISTNEVVAVKFSITAGLLQFELHKGLQDPNEVFTLID